MIVLHEVHSGLTCPILAHLSSTCHTLCVFFKLNPTFVYTLELYRSQSHTTMYGFGPVEREKRNTMARFVH